MTGDFITSAVMAGLMLAVAYKAGWRHGRRNLQTKLRRWHEHGVNIADAVSDDHPL